MSEYSGADTSGSLLRTKSFTYDAFGRRTTLTNAPTTPDGTNDPNGRFTYSYDAHGSVSQLLTSAATVQVAYGYRPYGDKDADLTKGEAADANTPINPYRSPPSERRRIWAESDGIVARNGVILTKRAVFFVGTFDEVNLAGRPPNDC